ncbi:MAG: 5-(carboxyamino)imidazole ribonucleotide synthase [Gammaproteobacteria bacterium]
MKASPALATSAPAASISTKKVGIIGGGQLGRMLALAGYPLGIHSILLASSADAPAAQVAEVLIGALDNAPQIAKLAKRVDVLTYEIENVPVTALTGLPPETRLRPPLVALTAGQDRLLEKQLFEAMRIPTTRYRTVDGMLDLESAAQEIGYPAMLKTRRLGYDGHGQRVIRSPGDLGSAFNALGGVPLILEEFIEFDREVSLVSVRNVQGATAFYPLTENHHREGILRLSLAPCPNHVRLQATAERYLERILQHFDYIGTFTVEFFVKRGRLYANETAPRVHNSGHWTIDGAVTSQFENHMRAILGLPLGSTATLGYSAMVNFIGEMPPLEAVLKIPGAHYHDYGKAPRPNRKLGHATLVCKTRKELLRHLKDFPGLSL